MIPDSKTFVPGDMRPRAARAARVAKLVAGVLVALAGAAGAPSAQAQGLPNAEANQLHAAIANGDVEALRYWLTVRHADANAPSDQEPGVTPLARCLGLAARVLDGPAGAPSSPGAPAAPVGLRVLQDMVALLDGHGARLADRDRQRTSEPVLRWYADAVGRLVPSSAPLQPPPSPTVPPASSASPGTPAPAAPTATAAAPAAPPAPAATNAPRATDPSSTQPKPGPVFVRADQRKRCNGSGHRVYLVNTTQLTIRASVTRTEGLPVEAHPRTSTDSYSLEAGSSWELGCDLSTSGTAVAYALDGWR